MESFQLDTGHKSAKEKFVEQILVSFRNSLSFPLSGIRV